jgi:hypothetical protein
VHRYCQRFDQRSKVSWKYPWQEVQVGRQGAKELRISTRVFEANLTSIFEDIFGYTQSPNNLRIDAWANRIDNATPFVAWDGWEGGPLPTGYHF